MVFYKTAYKKIPQYDLRLSPEENERTYKELKGQKVTLLLENLPHAVSKNQLVESDIPQEVLTNQYDSNYEHFRVPKHSGGYRDIYAPNDELKQLQRTVMHIMRDKRHILEHNAAHGFVKGRNCKTALKVHKANESNWFLKLDFHNFFPSWDIPSLTRQLTYLYNFSELPIGTVTRKIVELSSMDGHLVQGSPLSPYLTNLAMIPFDYTMTEYAKMHGIIYTRYADDMLFSSKERKVLEEVEAFVSELIKQMELPIELNESKTRLGSCAGRNWNLGIMYNRDHQLTVGYRNKHLMKVIIHKKDELSLEELLRWRGVLTYYKSIEPEYFARFDL